MIEWKEVDGNVLHGRDYTTKNLVGIQRINDNTVTALSVGSTTHPHDIGQANEDSVGVLTGDNYFFGIVCDSHFGGLFNQELVENFTSNFQINSIGNYTDFQQFVMDQIAHTSNLELIKMAKIYGELGETTLLIVLRIKDNIYWANIGDSMFYVFDEKGGELLNNDTLSYLSPRSRLSVNNLTWGEKIIEMGDTLILATDGIPGVYGAPPPNASDLIDLVSGSAFDIVGNLVKYAFNNGGEDNIGVIVSQFSY